MTAIPMREAIIVGAVALYVVLTTILTLVLRSRTTKEFMVGSRALPAGVIAVLLMSEFIGAKSTVGTAQEAFEHGMAASWSVLAASIGFLLLGLVFAKKIRASAQHTISGLIELRFGAGARFIVSILMIYALLLVNVGNYISGAAALSSSLHLNLTASTVVIAAVSSAYYVFGGLKSIAYVTVLHSMVKLVGVAILVGVALTLSGGVGPIVRTLPASYFTWDGGVGGSTILAWIVGTVGAIFSTQFIIQALAGSRSPEAARGSALFAALLCLPLGLALGFVGVAARYLHPAEKSLFALPGFIPEMPAALAAVVAVSLVASVLVSISTVALAITALVMRDFYVPWRKPDAAHELAATRWVSLAVGLAPLVFVYLAPHILALSFFTRALRLSIAIVALVGVYLPWLGSPRSAVTALVASGLATTAWYLLGNPYGIDNMYVAAFTPAAILLAHKLFSKRATPQPTPQPETIA